MVKQQAIIAAGLTLQVLHTVQGYNMTCPADGEWRQRSIICKSPMRYVCLFDEIQSKYREKCDRLVEVGKGFRNVIRQNIDRDPCSTGKYQPFKFSTNRQYDCIYLISLCTEAGQIDFDNGTTTRDRTCSCDYKKGYAFVKEPKNKCFCLPAEEDCSCFLKPCNGWISEDYECIFEEPVQLPYCEPISSTSSGSVIYMDLDGKNTKTRGKLSSKRITRYAILSFIVICITVIFCLICNRNLRSDVFDSHLENVACSFGGYAILTCEVTVKKCIPSWKKDKKSITHLRHIKTSTHAQRHTLEIDVVYFEDEGLFTLQINNETSQARLQIIDAVKITEDETNYLHIVHLLFKMAVPAVRAKFDEVFPPTELQHIITVNKEKLHGLLKDKYINSTQRTKLSSEHVSSENFDLRLMTCLLINSKDFKATNKAIHNEYEEDLDTIKSCRNNIAHSHGRLSNDEFEKYFKDVSESCRKLAEAVYHNYANGDVDTIALELTGSLTDNVDSKTFGTFSESEIYYLRIVHLLQRIACPAVRVNFDRIIPPKKLPSFLKEKKSSIKKICNHRQLDLLYPEKGRTSSRELGLKIMLLLLWNFKPKGVLDIERQALSSLESYLHTIAESRTGTLEKDDFDIYWKDICSSVVLLGGKRFKGLCAYLNPGCIPCLEMIPD